MTVSKILSLRKYFRSRRFAAKKPSSSDEISRCGDNRRDHFRNGGQVLIAKRFYYFGRNAIRLPSRFRKLEKKGPGFKSRFKQEFIEDVIAWLENKKPGLRGAPCALASRQAECATNRPEVSNTGIQIKFIRVGADLGCGRRLSRIFPGDYYHFIPIPKHNDPEFCRFTYGDVGKRRPRGRVATKGSSLSMLRKDDWLVFYAGFDPEDGARRRRLVGIFAYFVVKKAFLFEQKYKGVGARALCFSDKPRDYRPFQHFNAKSSTKVMKELASGYQDWNAHFCAGREGGIDIVICGDQEQSKLLSKVVVLAEFDGKNYKVGKQTANKWGLTRGHDLKMSPVRTVRPESTPAVLKELKRIV